MIPDKIRQIESNKEIVQKFTENYNNMTSNTSKYWVKPVRWNVTDKMGQDKNCKTCDSNPATWESKIVCLYDPFCDGWMNLFLYGDRQRKWHTINGCVCNIMISVTINMRWLTERQTWRWKICENLWKYCTSKIGRHYFLVNITFWFTLLFD